MSLMWRADGSGPFEVGSPSIAKFLERKWTLEDPKSKKEEPKKESKKSSFKKE